MTQEFVTLPRSVLEQALEAFEAWDARGRLRVMNALRAALDQPQNHIPGVRNMAPAGWKLVPVEPNCSMVLAGERSLEQHDFLRLDSAYRAMLDAAPKPPTVKDSLTVEQPQADQPAMTPIAQRKLEDLVASGYTISGYSIYHKQKHQHGFVTGAGLVGWWRPEGMEYSQPLGEQEPVADVTINVTGSKDTVDIEWNDILPLLPNGIHQLYINQQPNHELLTDEAKAAIDAARAAMDESTESYSGRGDVSIPSELAAALSLRLDEYDRAIEAAHNIK